MKKLFLALSLAGALAATLALGACDDGNTVSLGSADGKFAQLDTAQSVYAFSAASAGMIISGTGAAEDQAQPLTDEQTMPESAPPAGTQPGEDVQPDGGQEVQPGEEVLPDGGQEVQPGEEVLPAQEGLDRYMALTESLLSDGAFTVTETASEREEYQFKTTVSYLDLNGRTHTYEMHYDKTLIADDDDDDDETEEEYAIRGVMVLEGIDYAISGERETEQERGESESETEFVVQLGEGRRIVVEQSFEREHDEVEQEYSYTIYENGRKLEHSSFEYESEDGETEVKMTMTKDGQTEAFYFTREKVRGREVMILRTGVGKDSQSYYVTPVTDGDGNTRYEYQPISR